MSKIALVVETAHDKNGLLSRLRRVTACGFVEILSRIEQKRPVVEYLLFENDHNEVATKLRELLTISPTDATFRLFELMPDEDIASCPLDQCEISVETLKNILDTHDEQRSKLDY